MAWLGSVWHVLQLIFWAVLVIAVVLLFIYAVVRVDRQPSDID